SALRTALCALSCRRLFCNERAATGIHTLSLHDALPIFGKKLQSKMQATSQFGKLVAQEVTSLKEVELKELIDDITSWATSLPNRSEEHTSELQSRFDLVCRLLLEKKNTTSQTRRSTRPT